MVARAKVIAQICVAVGTTENKNGAFVPRGGLTSEKDGRYIVFTEECQEEQGYCYYSFIHYER